MLHGYDGDHALQPVALYALKGATLFIPLNAEHDIVFADFAFIVCTFIIR